MEVNDDEDEQQMAWTMIQMLEHGEYSYDDVTGEPLTVRALSSELNAEAALAKRCEIEQAEIGPLVHHLEQEGLLERLDASGAAEEVYASLLDVLSARGIPERECTT